jgi:ATP-dependent Lon protease
MQTIPSVLPVLPTRETVVFPSTVAPIVVGHERSLQLVNDALGADRLIAVVLQKGGERPAGQVGPGDLHTVGTMAVVHDVTRVSDHTFRLAVQGVERIRTTSFIRTEPYLVAHVEAAPDTLDRGTELEALMRTAADLFVQLVELTADVSDDVASVVRKLVDPQLPYMIAASMPLSTQVRQEILEIDTASAKLKRLVGLLQHEVAVRQVMQSVSTRTNAELSKVQREHILRKQIEAIQRELGDDDPEQAESRDLKTKLSALALPDEARREVEREVQRLERIPPVSPEHGIIRTYLDWVLKLPWGQRSTAGLEVAHAARVLDRDHYDLVKVKERIVDYVAVRKLCDDRRDELEGGAKQAARTEPILCLVGPPGVGKTSLGRSIARAMGRDFARQSLGGVQDEAEIRGHRRTYVGAMPGRIIQALARCHTADPVIVLDEIDKVGASAHGDPTAALLEVLDPTENSAFVDTYLGVPFDLSHVVFVCTANTTSTIPPALLDRMEILELPGYTEREKVEIAKRFLIPQQRTANGLREGEGDVTDDALLSIIRGYTREAGVRGLEREIATTMRRTARNVVDGKNGRMQIDPDAVRGLLGSSRYYDDIAERIDRPGIATGLSWTQAGGAVLFVEATMMHGDERVALTGMLGNVMRESAETALTYLRANAVGIGLDAEDLDRRRAVHVHVPAGSIPKDGPSAGVTILTALASCASGRVIRSDVAMTGEITLRGKVLPVAGIKEKVLAAHRAGVGVIILPRHNERDLEDVPSDVRDACRFVFVDTAEEVLAEALTPKV